MLCCREHEDHPSFYVAFTPPINQIHVQYLYTYKPSPRLAQLYSNVCMLHISLVTRLAAYAITFKNIYARKEADDQNLQLAYTTPCLPDCLADNPVPGVAYGMNHDLSITTCQAFEHRDMHGSLARVCFFTSIV